MSKGVKANEKIKCCLNRIEMDRSIQALFNHNLMQILIYFTCLFFFVVACWSDKNTCWINFIVIYNEENEYFDGKSR